MPRGASEQRLIQRTNQLKHITARNRHEPPFPEPEQQNASRTFAPRRGTSDQYVGLCAVSVQFAETPPQLRSPQLGCHCQLREPVWPSGKGLPHRAACLLADGFEFASGSPSSSNVLVSGHCPPRGCVTKASAL